MGASTEAESAEARRLAVLGDYMILDTPPEQDFDDIVHIASQLCNAPIALVSLVETDRQWFKAKVGVPMHETPISQSVCSLGLCQHDLLIIPDLTADPRTVDNTLVTGVEGLRFYAGAPLIAPRGEVVGMLCVIDTVPRPAGLTAEQKLVLAALARQVIVQLELRQAIVRRNEIDAERRLLNEELSHRLKNTLAMVQGIANQTLKNVTDRKPVEAFESRLLALSSAHDVLLQDNWSSARMMKVIEGGVELHGDRDRFMIDGPELTLGPRGALSTSMLLHELGTNAVKYGALSVEQGKVAVNWALEETGTEPMLVLEWREQGGPPATPPAERGFGSKLIGMGLAGARQVTEDYGNEGYSVTFRSRLAHLQQE